MLEPTSAERGVLDAVRFRCGQRARTGEVIAGRIDGREVDLGFASAEWRKIIVTLSASVAKRPGRTTVGRSPPLQLTSLDGRFVAEDLRVRIGVPHALYPG